MVGPWVARWIHRIWPPSDRISAALRMIIFIVDSVSYNVLVSNAVLFSRLRNARLTNSIHSTDSISAAENAKSWLA